MGRTTERMKTLAESFSSMKRVVLAIVSCVLVASFPRVATAGSGSDTTDWNEGKIVFRIGPGHASSREGDPGIYLYMQTQRIYGCCNFLIKADIDTLPDRIVITLRGIDRGNVGLTACGPAFLRRKLELTVRTYVLVFRTQTLSDTYKLIVDDKSIRVEGEDTTVSVPESNLFWKFPRHSFVLKCDTPVDKGWICAAFVDSLLRLGFVREFSLPENGISPYAPDRHEGGYGHPPETHCFLYNTEADFDSIGTLFRRFVSKEMPYFLSLRNWRNKWIR
jgi:hypothetical protein